MYNCIHHCTAALQIRLVGGGSNPFSGCVEYYLQGIWATVCDDYLVLQMGTLCATNLGMEMQQAHPVLVKGMEGLP